jgi:hypothetical protein
MSKNDLYQFVREEIPRYAEKLKKAVEDGNFEVAALISRIIGNIAPDLEKLGANASVGEKLAEEKNKTTILKPRKIRAQKVFFSETANKLLHFLFPEEGEVSTFIEAVKYLYPDTRLSASITKTKEYVSLRPVFAQALLKIEYYNAGKIDASLLPAETKEFLDKLAVRFPGKGRKELMAMTSTRKREGKQNENFTG